MTANVKIGQNCEISGEVKLRDGTVIRSKTIIYRGVVIGDNFQTGHGVLIREDTEIGDNVLVGSHSVIEGKSKIGDNTRIQSSVYIPINTLIEENVFIGPNAVLTNDKYPLRIKNTLKGPILRRGVTIGGNATILPGIEIGEGAFIAAGAVVPKDVPPWHMAVGNPAKIVELKEKLRVQNEYG